MEDVLIKTHNMIESHRDFINPPYLDPMVVALEIVLQIHRESSLLPQVESLEDVQIVSTRRSAHYGRVAFQEESLHIVRAATETGLVDSLPTGCRDDPS